MIEQESPQSYEHTKSAKKDDLWTATQRNKEYELLVKLTLGIASSRNIYEAFDFTLKNICVLTNWVCGDIWLCDMGGDIMKCIAAYCDDDKPELFRLRNKSLNMILRKGEGMVGKAWQTKNTVWIEDVIADTDFIRKEVAEECNIRSAIAIPIPLNDEVIAIIAFYLWQDRQENKEFVKMLTAVAGQLGQVIKQKQTEDYLRIAELKFRSMIESSLEAIIITDSDSRVVSWNRSAERMFQYIESEIIGMPLSLIIAEEGHDAYHSEINIYKERCEKPGFKNIIALEGRRKDGSHFPMEVSIGCWETEGIQHFSVIARDVTEKRNEAQQLLERTQKLAEEISIRKKIEDELQASANELRLKNIELEQFAYVASHDLQEPLRMVSSYAQLLVRNYKGKLGEDANEFIRFITEGAVRMQALINDLLTYSRIGTRGNTMEKVDFSEVIKTTLANLSLLIDETEAIIEYKNMPVVTGDGSQLVQLMQNLIANAIKFTEEGQTPHIVITAKDEDTEWLFTVADNGIGVPSAYRDRIFQIFQRLHTREKYSGTGIGLALCKRIVERHGGTIWAENGENGKGSRFLFTLKKA